MHPFDVDRKLESLPAAGAGVGVEAGDEGGGALLRTGLELLGATEVSHELLRVVGDHGRRVDREVGEHLGAERFEQVDAPQVLYDRPANLFVAGFIGSPAMNFLPCRLEESAGALRVLVGQGIALPVPPARTSRYQPHVGREDLLLGLRPEHILEQRPHLESNQFPFEIQLEVTEPMGMETLVYFLVDGVEVCGRVSPNAGARPGAPMRLVADLNHMHLIDDRSGKVL